MIEKRKKFGEELAQKRASLNLSLDEIAKSTKIRKRVLEALESGRFEELPPDVFTVGFLKAYAEQVGLDPGAVVAQYRRLREPETEQAGAAARPPREASRGLGWWLLAALLVCAAAGYFYYAHQESLWPFEAAGRASVPEEPRPRPNKPSPPKPASEATPQPAPEPALPRAAEGEQAGRTPTPVQPASPTEGSPSVGQPAAPVPSPQPPPPSSPPGAQGAHPSGDFVLRCAQSSWVELWGDGKRMLYREVSAGEELAFNGKRFKVSVGNAPSVQVLWKGQPVALPPAKGRVVKDWVVPPQPERGSEP